MDLSNTTLQVGVLSASAVIISALLSIGINIYLKRRDEYIQNKRSRDEQLKEKAHQGLEETTLFVHALTRAREDIRLEYEDILKDDRTRLAWAELQIAEQALNLAKCQDNHKASIEAIATLTAQLESITDRLSQHEIRAVQDEEYIECLQEDLAKAGITIRVRVYKHD